jgi:two-component system capsular synthesis sensor histidine kinase RcsC
VQRNFQGTGLGLAICELVSMMDGDISVDTEPGMGSQFTIRIPLYSAQYPAKATVDGLSDKRCWLAVHNASLNDYLTALLTHCGVRCRYEGQTPDVDDVLIADEMAAVAGGRCSSAVATSAFRRARRMGTVLRRRTSC